MSLYRESDGGVCSQLQHGSHILEPNLQQFVRSPEFRAAMERAASDEEIKARLMIQALKGISLSTDKGDTMDDFTIYYPENGRKMVCFWIKFHGWVNFIGNIDLPEGSEIAIELIEAIQENLNSRMFKAATVMRRIYPVKDRLYGQAGRKVKLAERQLNEGYAEKREEIAKSYSSFEERYIHLRALDEEIKAKVDELYDQTYNRRIDQLEERYRRVSRQAHPEFNGAYTEAVASFLYKHLPMPA